MLTEDQIQILKDVHADKVWTAKNEDSEHYTRYADQLPALIKMGLVAVFPNGCCAKEYMLTRDGMKAMQSAS